MPFTVSNLSSLSSLSSSNMIGLFIVSLIIFFIVFTIFKRVMNRTEPYQSTIDGHDYNIITKFNPDTFVGAADMLSKINLFVKYLLEYLSSKYTDPNTKEYRIMDNIRNRYDIDSLKENNPLTTNDTSYILNKGDEIAFCLREKESGNYKLHNFSDIKFVVLHELAHLGLDRYGHTEDYWKTFYFLLHEANNAGLYEPIDYSMPNNALSYCGVNVNVNPYYIDSLKF